MMNGQAKHPSLYGVAIGASAALLVVGYIGTRASEQETYHFAGWLLILAVGVLAFSWWRRTLHATSVCAAAIGTLGTLMIIGYSAAHASLHEVYFLSGWLAAFLIGVLAFAWWRSALDAASLQRRILYHLQGGSLLLIAVGVHTEFRVPNGGLETALVLLLASFVASLVTGAVLLRSPMWEADGLLSDVPSGSDEPGRVVIRRWLFIHVSLCFALLSIAIVHGLFVHSHGLLAYALLGK